MPFVCGRYAVQCSTVQASESRGLGCESQPQPFVKTDLPAADKDGIQALSVKGRSGRSVDASHSDDGGEGGHTLAVRGRVCSLMVVDISSVSCSCSGGENQEGRQVLGTKGRYCLGCNFSPESARGPRKAGSDLIETSQELRRRVLCNSLFALLTSQSLAKSYLNIFKSAYTSTHMSVCTHICTHMYVRVYIFQTF